MYMSRPVFEKLDFEYPKPETQDEKDRLFHLACADEFLGWANWFSGHSPTYFWEGLKKTASITGTYDPAMLSVITGNCENITEADKLFPSIKIARIMLKTFIDIDKD